MSVEYPLLPDIDRSGHCLTNTSVFTNWLGTGDVCNGRGACVNGLCVCDEGWTGRGDFLTLDGYACVVPVLLEEMLWYMVCVTNILGFLHSLKVLFDISKQKGTMRKWKMTFTAWMGFAFSLPMAALGFSRANLHQNVGVDVLPSVLLLVCIYVSQVLIGMDNLRFCGFLVSSNIANAQVKSKLMITLRRRQIGFISGLLFTLTVTVVVGVATPNAPTQVRYGLLIFRTIGLLAWFGELFAVNGLVLHELNKVKDSLKPNANRNSKDDKRLAAVIASLEAQLRELRYVIMVLGPLNIIIVACPPFAVFEFMLSGLMYTFTADVEVSKYAKVKSGRGEEDITTDDEEGMSKQGGDADNGTSSKVAITSGFGTRDAASNGISLHAGGGGGRGGGGGLGDDTTTLSVSALARYSPPPELESPHV